MADWGHLGSFIDLVTQSTIVDKLRNFNHDLTNHDLAWAVFAILAMFEN